MSNGAAITAQNLVRSFGATEAVRDVSFNIRHGEIFGFAGPDGAGKTTVMRMLAGVLRPDSGGIEVEGVNVITNPEGVKPLLSYMPQRFGLYDDLSVAENIFFYAELFSVPRKIRLARARDLLEAAGLTAFQKRLAGQLSGGMKQKLGLVCALIHTPSVLLLDEPTTGVDPVSRRDFWDLLKTLRESGVTIVLSTAYMDEAEYCNRIALIDAGKLIALGSPGELRRHDLGGQLFELECPTLGPTLGATLTAARQAPGVIEASIFADKLHVLLRAGTSGEALLAHLAAQGMAAGPIRAIAPSLEDVFVQLVSRRQEAGP
jgi:ABC-2 type transport system ATP-binding protein